MKLLVCGNRKIGRTDPSTPKQLAKYDTDNASRQRRMVLDYLSQLHHIRPISQIIAGEDGGAEKLGLHWARLNKIHFVAVRRLIFAPSILEKSRAIFTMGVFSPSDKKESMLDRNKRMLEENTPDVVLAFGTGTSTEALVTDARNRGIEIIEVDIPVNVNSTPLYRMG